MVDIKLDSLKGKSSKKGSRLTMTGRLTIEHSREVSKALRKALKDTRKLELEIEKIEDIDLSCIQLLCSAFKTATASKKRISIKGTAPKCFQEAVLEAGFYRQEGCSFGNDDDCFWLTNRIH